VRLPIGKFLQSPVILRGPEVDDAFVPEGQAPRRGAGGQEENVQLLAAVHSALESGGRSYGSSDSAVIMPMDPFGSVARSSATAALAAIPPPTIR